MHYRALVEDRLCLSQLSTHVTQSLMTPCMFGWRTWIQEVSRCASGNFCHLTESIKILLWYVFHNGTSLYILLHAKKSGNLHEEKQRQKQKNFVTVRLIKIHSVSKIPWNRVRFSIFFPWFHESYAFEYTWRLSQTRLNNNGKKEVKSILIYLYL